jgi:hypothetical protein
VLTCVPFGVPTVTDEPHELQIEVPPDLEVGVYANFALVSAGEHDITLDLCQLMPRPDESEPPRARVVGRVRLAPSFVGPLLQAISQNAFLREERLRKPAEASDEGGLE